MKRLHPVLWVFGVLIILGLASLGTPQESSAPPKDNLVLQDAIEVQPRGPLHEAYAQPFDMKAEPGTVIPREPPPMVPEEPPEQKPEAENTQWIPGYWSWDAPKQEFLWVSGVYRVPPQDRKFIPGYWQHATDGWRWVTGFWSNARQEELPYTPEPPATLDNGPGQPAPDDNSTYNPGSWIFRTSRFVWRPGYWSAVQDGRVWTPPHYVWTPNGYLFVDGYWDYPLEARGLAFAPVYFSQPLWNDPSWRYRPSYVVNPDAIFDSAFVGPAGFYFGNYYDPLYARSGYRHWYAGRGRYDPTFAYHGWQNRRTNANWAGGAAQLYGNRASGRLAAPPSTFAHHATLARSASKGSNPFVMPIVTPVNQFKSKQMNLVRATPAQLETQRTLAQGTRIAAQNRNQFDGASAGKSNAGRTFPVTEPRSLGSGTSGTGAHGLTPRTTISQATPQIVTPRTIAPQTRTVTPTYTPRVVTPPSPRTATPTYTPRVVTPAPAYRKTASVVNTTPRIVTNAAPQIHRSTSTPARASVPARAAPVRVSAPARTTNHAPAHTGGGSSRPSGGRKR
jgi:hypothetical protein